MIRILALSSLAFVLAACDRAKIAPELTTSLAATRTSATSVLIKVHVRNDRDTASVPLDVEVTAEPRTPAAWGQPVRVIHPVPFVLNKHESRDLETTMITSTGARATLSIHEAERGRSVVTKTAVVE